MKVGDLVRHRHGTIQGEGIILRVLHRDVDGSIRQAELLWTGHGGTMVHPCYMQYMEVISGSR